MERNIEPQKSHDPISEIELQLGQVGFNYLQDLPLSIRIAFAQFLTADIPTDLLNELMFKKHSPDLEQIQETIRMSEIADLADIAKPTVWRRIKNRNIPTIKVGNELRIHLMDLPKALAPGQPGRPKLTN